ncbi:MAG: GIY-YIG nuclease family protein [Rhodospirillaceae bacterium]|nr:GIY-YIG nuclease family protein [Rhodospirillaceae bacterium]
MSKTYYVYILASGKKGTLYVGVTNDLARRMHEHKGGLLDSFAKKHGVKKLVHFESGESAEGAIAREKSIKHWTRAKKLNTIESVNPLWRALSEDFTA